MLTCAGWLIASKRNIRPPTLLAGRSTAALRSLRTSSRRRRTTKAVNSLLRAHRSRKSQPGEALLRGWLRWLVDAGSLSGLRVTSADHVASLRILLKVGESPSQKTVITVIGVRTHTHWQP